MDFRTITENGRYGVRVSAIVIQDGQLLTYKVADGQNHLIGGAIKIGESSHDAIMREVKEELGLESVVTDLMFVVENCFDYCGELHHMIEFHYKVNLLGVVPKTTVDEESFVCEWLPLENLSEYDVRPHYLQKELLYWKGSVKHIVLPSENF